MTLVAPIKDHVAAAYRANVFLLQLTQECVVVRNVVLQLPTSRLNRGPFVIAPALYPMLLTLSIRVRADYLMRYSQVAPRRSWADYRFLTA